MDCKPVRLSSELVNGIHSQSGLVVFAVEVRMITQVFTQFRAEFQVLAQIAVRHRGNGEARGQIADHCGTAGGGRVKSQADRAVAVIIINFFTGIKREVAVNDVALVERTGIPVGVGRGSANNTRRYDNELRPTGIKTPIQIRNQCQVGVKNRRGGGRSEFWR